MKQHATRLISKFSRQSASLHLLTRLSEVPRSIAFCALCLSGVFALAFAPPPLIGAQRRPAPLPSPAGTALVELVVHSVREGLSISYLLTQRTTADGGTTYDLIGTVVADKAIPLGSKVEYLNITSSPRADTRRLSPTRSRLLSAGKDVAAVTSNTQEDGKLQLTIGDPSAPTLRIVTDPSVWAFLGVEAPSLPTVAALLLSQEQESSVESAPIACSAEYREALESARRACANGVKSFSYTSGGTRGKEALSFECQPNPTPKR